MFDKENSQSKMLSRTEEAPIPQQPSREAESQSHSLLYIGEIKRFITYYSTCLYYQKQVPDESKIMKDSLNALFQELLLSLKNESGHQVELVQIFNAILGTIKDNESQILSSIWKASIKTLIKLLSFPQVVGALTADESLDCNKLVDVFIEAQIDPVDHSEEEQKLLLKQKMLVKIVKTFSERLSQESQVRVFKYVLSVVKKQTVDDLDQYYSLQFGDAVKKHMHSLLAHYMSSSCHSTKSQVLNLVLEKTRKKLRVIISNQEAKKTQPSQGVGQQVTLKVKEYLCLLIKSIEDCFKKLTKEEVKDLIMASKDSLFETLCLGAEQEDIMIRNQTQQLFSYLLSMILECKLPMREELEILLVKIVMKPALLLTQTMELNLQKEGGLKKSGGSTSSAQGSMDTPSSSGGARAAKNPSISGGSTPSASAVTGAADDSDIENDDFIQVQYERTLQEDLLLEMSMNYLLETLMFLKPDQLAQLFLMYDCQPFSENFVSKSIQILLKYASQRPELFMRVFECLLHLLEGVEPLKPTQAQGMQMIYMMLEQKAQTRRFAKDLNAKYKNFLNKLDDLYSYMEVQTPAEVASKMLAYSRDVQISKVIEVIGGKDERGKRIMKAFLDKMDFSDGNIETSMRRFLQTFRLAGVDSQVVGRIIENFGHKFHEMDQRGIFVNEAESYDFAYLIIVLQTSQHNPSVKTKIDLKSFIEQARINCPKSSSDTIPEGFFEEIFHSVTNTALFTPVSRSLIEESYNIYNKTEVKIRLSKSSQGTLLNEVREFSETEFVNSADLTNKQLFHFSNSVNVPASLIPLALRHLLTFLTQRFIKYAIATQNASIEQQADHSVSKFKILKSLIELNKNYANLELVDRLFQVIYKVTYGKSHLRAQLEGLLWDNFDCLKRSLVLLPKLSMQSFLKDEVRDTIKQAFGSVRRLIVTKYSDKGASSLKGQEGNSKSTGVAAHHQAPAKTTSFFDLVYNYFTENADQEDPLEKLRREEDAEILAVYDIKSKLLMEEKEGDYQESIEEKFDDKLAEQWGLQKTRLQEMIALLCSQIRENQNQEEGTLCLAFLYHIIRKSDDHSIETLEKLWIEMHLLIGSCLKTKSIELPTLTSSNSNDTSKAGEYEVVSTDTSQDSMETHGMGDYLDVYTKETDPIRTRIYEAANRHIILNLHLQLGKEILSKKQQHEGGASTQHIIREVQRIISQVIETGDSQGGSQYPLFDEISFYEYLQGFFSNHFAMFKSYPKISKLVRLMMILILKSQTSKLNQEEEDEGLINHNQVLVLRQINFFKIATELIKEIQLPFDLIGLALDVFSKIQLPTYVRERNQRVQQIVEGSIAVMDNITMALQKQTSVTDESGHEVWLKSIQIMQDKILLNPSSHAYVGMTLPAFNLVKNAVLTHQFEITSANYPLVKRLFQDVLFNQTMEKLASISGFHPGQEESKENLKVKNEQRPGKKIDGDSSESEDNSGDAGYRLEQMCMIAVNNLSDIFIYYIATVHRESEAVEGRHQLLSYLWLSLLKVVLNYAEQGNQKDLHGLVVCSHDNIKRVMEFMIHQQILIEPNEETPQSAENSKLWKTSWDIIGAFFTEMKANVLNKPDDHTQPAAEPTATEPPGVTSQSNIA